MPTCRQPLPALPLLAAMLALLVGCASGPPTPRAPAAPSAPSAPSAATPAALPTPPLRDGPETQPPVNLLDLPDAEPHVEPVRPGGPNKPYEVQGQTYVPLQGDPPLVERGLASWYGRKFHGRSTANGETYNMYAMTAAHKTMPLPSYARVRNPANGREVVVRINDRGPFHANRVIDLSYTAALKLGLLNGVAPVEVHRITYESIRTGTWRLPADDSRALARGGPLSGPVALADATPDPTLDPIADIARRSADIPVGAPPAAAVAAAQAAALSPARAAAKSARGFWIQLGAFAQQDGAVAFQQQVAREAAWLAPLMAIYSERNLHRLQAGPYASRADAQGAAERLRATLQLLPAIVERR